MRSHNSKIQHNMKNMPQPILNSQKMILTSKKSTLNSKPSPCSVCIYLWSERKKLIQRQIKNSDHSRQKINIQHLKSQFNISNTSDQSTSSPIFLLLLPVPIPRQVRPMGELLPCRKKSSDTKIWTLHSRPPEKNSPHLSTIR